MKKILFCSIGILFLLLACNKSEQIPNVPLSTPIANNEDFKWVSTKTAELSNNITKHLSTLSEVQILELKKTLQSENQTAKIQLMSDVLGFKNQNDLQKFADEYDNRVKKVSIFVEKNSLKKEYVSSVFEELTSKNLRIVDPCDQYESCVHKKFAEGGVNGFFSGAITAALGGGWLSLPAGVFGGAATTALWHATFGDCAGFREKCQR